MRSKGTLGLLVIVLLVAFAGCAGCGTYNSLVAEEENVEEAWANVETQYQRRADLIPNLVSTVRGAADFERGTLEAVTNARARATSINLTADDLSDPARVRQFQEAQAQLGGALSRLLFVAENYPDLRATEAFRDLQTQLEGTENRINVARTRYNDAVRIYNTKVRKFPAALFAGILGFTRRASFEADPGAEQAPTVDFNS
ncbi:MAG: LemA family protein [Rhodothermales bacterium]